MIQSITVQITSPFIFHLSRFLWALEIYLTELINEYDCTKLMSILRMGVTLNKVQVKVILNMYLLVVQSDLYQEVTSQSGTFSISTTGNSCLIKRPPNCSFFKSLNPISLNYCYKNHGTSVAEVKFLTKRSTALQDSTWFQLED